MFFKKKKKIENKEEDTPCLEEETSCLVEVPVLRTVWLTNGDVIPNKYNVMVHEDSVTTALQIAYQQDWWGWAMKDSNLLFFSPSSVQVIPKSQVLRVNYKLPAKRKAKAK